MSTPAPPHYTSVPPWTREPVVESPDATGTAFTVLAVGTGSDATGAAAIVDAWLPTLPVGAPVQVHTSEDVAGAIAAMRTDLAGARVGHRVLVAGSATDCLAVRAAALGSSLMDSELTVGVTSVATRAVWCVHCSATTIAEAGLEDVVTCPSCRKDLVVYPHVSRRTGAHLGFQVDAETLPAGVTA
ncbi:dimethylamine monooxygenase subunit DmmA family protein [Nocardioides bruguierae]|uniref:Dimethylamine monooxygenase subunit DmmA-like C-terminal domain-containing protein n=1 Tax=Nocardioides bruguierae TaxID=2945102 RepID=A0A9X2D7M8_9ACTN|nr:dimethylamine monooxygenase subunit DmmA family protein [Nocardioides bruguierae]MCM0620763.1 hypothetical protein [Nocardioides bruguierae]